MAKYQISGNKAHHLFLQNQSIPYRNSKNTAFQNGFKNWYFGIKHN